jgi:hypothetical protein
MDVNNSDQINEPPRNLIVQARLISTLLGVAENDLRFQARIETFILCNGFHGVYVAAQATARLLKSEAISDPWSYTIRAYNQNLARASYLYTLTHWVENGLRSQLDLHNTKYFGATWHRQPVRYMESRDIVRFRIDHQQEMTWQAGADLIDSP